MADYIDSLIDAANHRRLTDDEQNALVTEVIKLRTQARSRKSIGPYQPHRKVDPTQQVVVYAGENTPLTIVIDPRRHP